MAFGTYATWQDVYALLRKAATLGYGTEETPADSKAVTAILSLVHQQFDIEMRMNSTVDVPIDEDLSPDSFATAKTICAMRGTAAFLKQQNQNQGKDPEDWFTIWAEKIASDLMEKLQTPHGAPADAVAPTSPRAYLPKVQTVADTDAFAAKFGLQNVESGRNTHW